MTPWTVSVAAVAVSLLLLGIVVYLIRSRRLRERYALLWLLNGSRPARALGLARRAEHDRRLARRHRLPAGRALRDGNALHPRGAPALLNRDLAPVGPDSLLAQRLALLEERLRREEESAEAKQAE